MPNRTRVPCRWPSCSELIQPGDGYCSTHVKKANKRSYQSRRDDPTRCENDSFYSTGVWARARTMYIRQNPLCSMCGDVGRLVDHIIPRRAGGESLDASNFQTLCFKCHAIKTAKDANIFKL